MKKPTLSIDKLNPGRKGKNPSYSEASLRSVLILSLAIIIGLQSQASGQSTPSDSLLPYLHGVRANGALVMNVRGYEVFVETRAGSISNTNVQKKFPAFSLNKSDVAAPDTGLNVPAMVIEKQVLKGDLEQHGKYYFISKGNDSLFGIAIIGTRASEKSFDRAIVDLVVRKGIPDSLVSDLRPPVLLFAGRTVPVDSRCMWMGSNVMQCHGFGEMNWSMHPSMEEAMAQTAGQESINRQNKTFDIEKEEAVPVQFEGSEVIARRRQFRVKGVKGLLAKQEGSRTLIVYYVAAPVRGRYVSCVLSHWTSDYITNSGLPPLLETVMQLK